MEVRGSRGARPGPAGLHLAERVITEVNSVVALLEARTIPQEVATLVGMGGGNEALSIFRIHTTKRQSAQRRFATASPITSAPLRAADARKCL